MPANNRILLIYRAIECCRSGQTQLESMQTWLNYTNNQKRSQAALILIAKALLSEFQQIQLKIIKSKEMHSLKISKSIGWTKMRKCNSFIDK